MTCTIGDEVIQTSDGTNSLASTNVQAGAVIVESGKCYNQVGVNISDDQGTNFYQIGVWDEIGGVPTNLLGETISTTVPVPGFIYLDIPEFTAPSGTIWIGCQGTGGNILFGSITGTRKRDANTFGSMPDPWSTSATQTKPPAFKIKHDGTGHESTGGPGGTVKTKAKEQLPDRPTLKSEGIANSTLKLKTILIQTGKLWFQKRLEALATLPKLQAKGVVLSKIRYETRNHANARLNFRTKNEAFSIAEIGCQIAYTLTELHKSVEQENKVNKLKLLAEVFQNG